MEERLQSTSKGNGQATRPMPGAGRQRPGLRTKIIPVTKL